MSATVSTTNFAKLSLFILRLCPEPAIVPLRHIDRLSSYVGSRDSRALLGGLRQCRTLANGQRGGVRYSGGRVDSSTSNAGGTGCGSWMLITWPPERGGLHPKGPGWVNPSHPKISAKRPHSGAQNASATFLSRGGVLASERLRFARSLLYGTRRSQLTDGKTLRIACQLAKSRCSTRVEGLVSSNRMTVALTFSFTSQHCEMAMKSQGKAVKFEIGVDPKSGKTKAVSVDLT
jgi:hypothetical protein